MLRAPMREPALKATQPIYREPVVRSVPLEAFTAQWDSWIHQQTSKIAGDTKDFEDTSKTLDEEIKSLQTYKDMLMIRRENLHAQTQEEAISIAEISTKNTNLLLDKNNAELGVSEVESAVKQLAQSLEKLQLAHNSRVTARENQLKTDRPIAEFYQKMFAMKVIPVKSGEILFAWTHIHAKNWDNVYEIVLQIDSESQVYNVAQCQPKLQELADMVAWLNESKDLYHFLRIIRAAFVAYAKTE